MFRKPLLETPTLSQEGTSRQTRSNRVFGSPFVRPNYLPLPNIARQADRFQLSDLSVSKLAGAVLLDFGMADSIDVVSRSKVRRARQAERSERVISDARYGLAGIGFDGRIDMTLALELDFNGRRISRRREEHLAFTADPSGDYIQHKAIPSGRAEHVAAAVYAVVQETSSEDTIRLLLCDGAATNVGESTGALRRIEQQLNRALFHSVCLLHTNELPLRALFLHLDGVTTGPRSFTGVLGTALQNAALTKLPIVAFAPIDPAGAYLDVDDDRELSSDQNYLLIAWRATCDGTWSGSDACRSPGALCHSRWLTFANRLLRLYASTSCPSAELVHLVTYVIRVYAPSWFAIRRRPSITFGSYHFLAMLTSSNYLEATLRRVVHNRLRANSYFAHSEAIIVALLGSTDAHERLFGYQMLRAARLQARGGEIRVYRRPRVITSANCLRDLINWQREQLTPPSVLDDVVSDEMITEVLQENRSNRIVIDHSCHSQVQTICFLDLLVIFVGC